MGVYTTTIKNSKSTYTVEVFSNRITVAGSVTGTTTTFLTLSGGKSPTTTPDFSSSSSAFFGSSFFQSSSSSSAAAAATAKGKHHGSSGLSTGAQAGIGVGVGLAGLLLIVGLVVFFLRRRRANQTQNTAKAAGTEEAYVSEKRQAAPNAADTSAGANGGVLPTWKSELDGQAARVELEDTGQPTAELEAKNEGVLNTDSEKRGVEMDTVRSPKELEGSPFTLADKQGMDADNKQELPESEQQVSSPQQETSAGEQVIGNSLGETRAENVPLEQSSSHRYDAPPISSSSKPDVG